MILNQKNSKKQGDVGIGVAIGWFAAQGYTVCVPLTDSQDFDLVVEMENDLKKIQVKTTRHKNSNGIYEVNLRTCGGNRSGTGKVKLFNQSSVDYVFALTANKDMYLIPSYKIDCKRGVALGEKYKDFFVGHYGDNTVLKSNNLFDSM